MAWMPSSLFGGFPHSVNAKLQLFVLKGGTGCSGSQTVIRIKDRLAWIFLFIRARLHRSSVRSIEERDYYREPYERYYTTN